MLVLNVVKFDKLYALKIKEFSCLHENFLCLTNHKHETLSGQVAENLLERVFVIYSVSLLPSGG
jgi:hypothetical protein